MLFLYRKIHSKFNFAFKLELIIFLKENENMIVINYSQYWCLPTCLFFRFPAFVFDIVAEQKYRKTIRCDSSISGVSFTSFFFFIVWSTNHASIHPHCFSILHHIHQTRPPVFFMRIPETQQLFSYLSPSSIYLRLKLCFSLSILSIFSSSSSLSLSLSHALSIFSLSLMLEAAILARRAPQRVGIFNKRVGRCTCVYQIPRST